jgi:hypothetical protein
VPEVVINICDYPLVEQLSLASAEYPAGVDEFVKAGLTAVPSSRVRPPRVAECPVAIECVVEQIIALSDTPGHGNLVICRIVQAQFREAIVLADKLGIGFDELPDFIRTSPVLTGNELARLANVEREALPTPAQVEAIKAEPMVAYLLTKHRADPAEANKQLVLLAQQWLASGRIAEAWQVLLAAGPAA